YLLKFGILLWYNSSGDWNDTPYTPKNLLINHESRMKEFNKIKEMGAVGVKVDFFGGDGQSVIEYYHGIMSDAAKVGLMVNFHGCTLPRGWQRTYPNLVNMESVKGMEFLTFDQRNADVATNHNSVLPYTRNIYDPMDYTPVCFSEIPNFKRYSTQAHELALAVIFLGGIQHYAEIPEGMAKVPNYVKELMKEIPIGWDETKFIDGYPGKDAIIARRSGDTWYIAGINGENKKKEYTIDLSFTETTKGILVNDGNNNRSFTKLDVNLNISKTINIGMKENGGFLIKL
ncbi:glycoside hydrolase family 97 catalytic domain-containing protein, partial [Bacteroidota bacterium]